METTSSACTLDTDLRMPEGPTPITGSTSHGAGESIEGEQSALDQSVRYRARGAAAYDQQLSLQKRKLKRPCMLSCSRQRWSLPAPSASSLPQMATSTLPKDAPTNPCKSRSLRTSTCRACGVVQRTSQSPGKSTRPPWMAKQGKQSTLLSEILLRAELTGVQPL